MSTSASTDQHQSDRRRHAITCAWFWGWTSLGALAALGFVVFGTIGLGAVLIIGAALSTSHSARRSTPGVLAGVGLIALLIAYSQRQGPGTTCWHTATAAGCDQHLNPIPWLVIGVLLIVAALFLQNRRDD